MTRKGRGADFTPEEDMQIVQLRVLRWTYPEIAHRLARSVRSLQSRAQRLERSGEASAIRRYLIEKGTSADQAG